MTQNKNECAAVAREWHRQSSHPIKVLQIVAPQSSRGSQSAKCHRKQLALAEMRACPSDWGEADSGGGRGASTGAGAKGESVVS